MNLLSPAVVRDRLAALNLRPSRRRGQNFLIDANVADIVVDAADPGEGDGVLEVGPGLGGLTQRLLARGCRVWAVEIDRRLADHLAATFADDPSFSLTVGDARGRPFADWAEQGVRLVAANLPYSVGSRLVMDWVTGDPAPDRIAVTVQKEVADRITAEPGRSAFGLMGLWCRLRYDVRRRHVVSPSCFYPRPAVSSAVVSMVRRAPERLTAPERETLYRLSRIAFGGRRKQLAVSLASDRAGADALRRVLEKIGADPKARPASLSMDQWCALVRTGTRP